MNRHLCEWISCRHIAGACQSDGICSDNLTVPPLKKIQGNVPQSNVTGPNNSNVVSVHVSGNLYEEKKVAVKCGELSGVWIFWICSAGLLTHWFIFRPELLG